MKILFFLCFINFLFVLTGFTQTISGRVIDSSSQEPVIGATVKLVEKGIQTSTDQDGKFTLQGIGMLEVSMWGYQTYITASNDSSMQISLTAKVNEVQTIELTGRSRKDYNSDYSFSATKIAISNNELPQSLTTVTKELITDRQAFQLADAVKVVSGVTPSSYYNQYNIRGISQNEEGQIINGMRTRQHYFLQPLTTNIERVEVLKGPASVTFSSVDPGGSINMVTKKPLRNARREVGLSVGSFATMRGTLDFTGPLNESKTLLYRINSAYQEAKSFRDLVQNNTILVSPSFSYVPNGNTSVNAELIYNNLNGQLDRGQPIFGAVDGKTNLNSTPISLNLGAGNDYYRSRELLVMTTLSHKFNEKISFNASYMKQTWQEDLQEHRTTNAFAPDLKSAPYTSQVMMQFVQRRQNWNVDNLNAYFNLNSGKSKIDNNLLFGYDLGRWQKLKGGGQNSARGFLLKDGSVASSFVAADSAKYQTVVVDGKVLPRPNVQYFNLNSPSYTFRNSTDYVLNNRTSLPSALTTTHAVYIQNHFKFGKLSALVTLRHEWFEDITNYDTPAEKSFTNSALLPRVGLTYSINKIFNIYGAYLKGYQPQANTVSLMPATGNFYGTAKSAAQFKPLESDLKEVGSKAEFMNGRIQMNLAVYEINQKNILMSANDPSQPDALVQRGADRSRGLEFDISGYLTNNWQIFASYSFIDAVIINDAKEELKGKRKENTPKNNANLWTRYNFKENTLFKNLGIGMGIQHQGSKIPWFTRVFEVPAFTIFDAAIYYAPVKSSVQIALNAGNVFNKTYWLGAQNYTRLFPGAPRNFILTATYRF